jgi:probable phosphoglycerate mutase
MAQIVLIRPGCTEFDEQQRIQGNLDLPLSTCGRQQVEQLLADLAHVEIDYLFSSPCEPARSTAEALGATRGLAVREVEDLHNVNLGLWQGLKVEDVRRKHPKVFKQWQDSPEAICPPEGETLAEAVDRVRKALEKPLKKKGNLAIVAADPLAAIVCMVVRGLTLESIPAVCQGTCGSWEVLCENPSNRLSGQFAVAPASATVSRSSRE